MGWQGGLKGQSPRQPRKGIPGDGVATDIACQRVLGEEAPEQHKFPPEEVGSRFATALGSHHESNGIGGVSIVGGDASGDGSSKLGQQMISRWGCFRAIAGNG